MLGHCMYSVPNIFSASYNSSSMPFRNMVAFRMEVKECKNVSVVCLKIHLPHFQNGEGKNI